jgi:hypothetical protein
VHDWSGIAGQQAPARSAAGSLLSIVATAVPSNLNVAGLCNHSPADEWRQPPPSQPYVQRHRLSTPPCPITYVLRAALAAEQSARRKAEARASGAEVW